MYPDLRYPVLRVDNFEGLTLMGKNFALAQL